MRNQTLTGEKKKKIHHWSNLHSSFCLVCFFPLAGTSLVFLSHDAVTARKQWPKALSVKPSSQQKPTKYAEGILRRGYRAWQRRPFPRTKKGLEEFQICLGFFYRLLRSQRFSQAYLPLTEGLASASARICCGLCEELTGL